MPEFFSLPSTLFSQEQLANSITIIFYALSIEHTGLVGMSSDCQVIIDDSLMRHFSSVITWVSSFPGSSVTCYLTSKPMSHVLSSPLPELSSVLG